MDLNVNNNVYTNNGYNINLYPNNLYGLNNQNYLFQNSLIQNNIFQNNQNIFQNNILPNNYIINNSSINNLNLLLQYYQNIQFQNNNINNLSQGISYDISQQTQNYNINNNIISNNQNNFCQNIQQCENISQPTIQNYNNLNKENNSEQKIQVINEEEKKETINENEEENGKIKKIKVFFCQNKKNHIFFFHIQKFDAYILIRSDKYEAYIDEKELSNIIKINLESIDEAYNYIISKFQSNNAEIGKITKKKEMELILKVNIGKSKKLKSLVISLIYNEGENLYNPSKRGIKMAILELKNKTKSMIAEFNKLTKMKQRLNELIKKKRNDRNQTHLATRNYKHINITTDSYAEYELDNTFTCFRSIDKILCLIYSTENFCIISYDLTL